MDPQIYAFEHHDVAGAIIRVLEDEELSLNEFLTKDRQSEDVEDYAFAYTACYLNHRGRHILIDAGFDPDTVPGALESLGVAAEDIEFVLLTHADRDHVAGLLMQGGGLTYPTAEHVIGQMLWENLSRPETLDALPEDRAPFFRRLVSAFDDTIRRCADGETVADGIRFLLHHGHRVGHAVYEITAAGASIVHTGDAFFHRVFAEHPNWANPTDSLPAEAVESRSRLVPMLADTGALVLSTHLPFPGMGFIRRETNGYHWEPFSL